MVDYAMMSRNVRGFMSLFHGDKPVVCKVHGFCVAGGTDMALCSRPARHRGRREDRLSAGARVGRADDRAVGAPHRPREGEAPAVHRRLPVGQARRSSGASRSSARRADELDERFEILLERIARMPINQLVMMKLLLNQTRAARRACTRRRSLGTVFDGIARHTPEGYAFQQPRRGGRLQAGGARARRAVRRLRPVDVQGLVRS